MQNHITLARCNPSWGLMLQIEGIQTTQQVTVLTLIKATYTVLIIQKHLSHIVVSRD